MKLDEQENSQTIIVTCNTVYIVVPRYPHIKQTYELQNPFFDLDLASSIAWLAW